jgi:hypothetical protein
MGIIEIIGLIFGGGATGLFGTLANRFINLFEAKQRNAHELQLLEIHYRQRGMELEQERLISESQSAADIRTASYAHDTGYGKGSKWVVNTLRLFRPMLTLMLLALLFIIWCYTSDLALIQQIVAAVIYLSITALTWWFGDRGMATMQQGNKLPWQ